ncbi:MAG: MtnX-like HAD-IB family phosphatase [Magnetococcus sp. MYC-9]
MKPHILCDFDGTIVPEDVTDALLERFARPEWRHLEQEWRAGRIGSLACMQAQIALLQVSPAELDHYLDQVAIDPDFVPFVQQVRRLGWKLTVVSDGIDYVIHRILARHGLDYLPVFANHLARLHHGGYHLSFPHSNPACLSAAGTCKCRFAEPAFTGGSPCLLIGDGNSDRCVAAAVPLVWAKEGLLHHCRQQGLPHWPCRHFRDALAYLDAPSVVAQLLAILEGSLAEEMPALYSAMSVEAPTPMFPHWRAQE